MAHVQIRGGVADWYWTADLGCRVNKYICSWGKMFYVFGTASAPLRPCSLLVFSNSRLICSIAEIGIPF